MEDYTLEELEKEQADKLTEELQAVLAKYDAEMGVSSTINLMRRVPVGIPSPITPEDLKDDNTAKDEEETV